MAIENKKLAVLFASQKKTEQDLFFEMKTMIVDIAKNLLVVDVELETGESVPYLHSINSFRIKSDFVLWLNELFLLLFFF